MYEENETDEHRIVYAVDNNKVIIIAGKSQRFLIIGL